MTARAKTGCQACRVRHLKCDQKVPTCGRCQTSGRECTRGYPYRYQQSRFSEHQKWMKPPTELRFVDETEEIAGGYDEGSDDEDTIGNPFYQNDSASTPASQPPIESPNLTSYGTVILPPLHSIASLANTSTFLPSLPDHQARLLNLSDEGHQLPSPVSSVNREQYHANGNTSNHSNLLHSSDSGFEPPLSPSIYLDKSVWPLKDPAEALLLRHFVQKLAIWLDLCDPKQHFQVEVPKRAGTCPILLNAIFALSARHLSHIGNYDRYASNRYHNECLKYLIPMLDNKATVSDETLFAATIILRVLEEIDLPENDVQGYMLGIQVFVGARDPYAMRGGLSEAAFWVGLRQEIYSAMMQNKTIALNLENCLVDRSVEPTSDFGWANRAVVNCAYVLNCCFGPTGVSLGHWKELKSSSEMWSRYAPTSFAPIYSREPIAGKEAFPEIWYSMACHIIGVQHHKLAEILLCIFDPRRPKVGGARSIAVRSMEEEIKLNLRSLCGIGLYNRWTPPGMFTASMGIAICGDRFSDRLDQEALLDVLVKTEQDHARPTALVQEQMKRSWGWTQPT